MAGTTSGAAPQRATARADVEARQHRTGWATFAGTMLAIVGALNIIYGIGAISDSKVYVNNVQYVFGDLNTWGWFMLCVGAIQVVTAFGIWNGSGIARWVGVGAASANALIQLLFLPSFPLLSLALFGVDVLVIYGLIAHATPEELRELP